MPTALQSHGHSAHTGWVLTVPGPVLLCVRPLELYSTPLRKLLLWGQSYRRRNRFRVVKWPAKGHAARELWSWDSKPGLFVPQYKTTESSWGKVSTECYSRPEASMDA